MQRIIFKPSRCSKVSFVSQVRQDVCSHLAREDDSILDQPINFFTRKRMGFSHIDASRQELTDINVAVARECERVLIGSNEDQVRFVVERSRIDSTQPGTCLKLESVTHPTDPKRSFLVTHRVSAERVDRPFNPKNLLGGVV